MGVIRPRTIPILITALIPLLADVFFSLSIEDTEHMLDEPGVLIFNTLWLVWPFVLLLALSIQSSQISNGYWRASVTGVLVALLAWSWFTYDGYRYQVTGQGGGANIGLGLVMMVIPIALAVLMPIIALLTKAKANNG